MSDEKAKDPSWHFPAIEEDYGKPVGHWQDLVRARGDEPHEETVEWLESEHGLGHGHADAIVAFTRTG